MSAKKTVEARVEDKVHEIVLKIEGERVDSASFYSCVENFFGLLKEVQRTKINDKERLTWLISVDRGSCVIRATPLVSLSVINDLALLRHTLDSGIKTLEESDCRPDDFTDEAIEKLRHLASKVKVSSEGVGITKLQINSDGGFKNITSQCALNASRLLTPLKPAFGSIRGRLEVIAGHDGLSVQIHNENRRLRVDCMVEESFLDLVMKAFRKRVSVYGKITYDRSRRPVRITLQSLRIIEESENLPKMYDVLGALNA